MTKIRIRARFEGKGWSEKISRKGQKMKHQQKSKSLILQKVVSENPEKILFGRKDKIKLKMGEQISSFLNDLMQNRGEMKHLVLELGVKRNSSEK